MRCIENVYARGEWTPHRCHNEAKGGDYCKVHDPAVKMARKAERLAKWKTQWDAEIQARELRVAGEELLIRLAKAWDRGEVSLPTGSDLLAAMQQYSVMRRASGRGLR